MTLPTNITISNPNVASGQAITLTTKTFTTNWQAYTNATNKPNMPGQTYDARLSKGVNTGFNNPTYAIQGVINLNETQDSTNTSMNTYWVKELMTNSEQVCTLTSTKLQGNTANVMIKSYSDTLTNTNVLNYTLNVLEVNSNS